MQEIQLSAEVSQLLQVDEHAEQTLVSLKNLSGHVAKQLEPYK